MKISILLPYKENFSPINAGAVSIFINDTTKLSKFRNNLYIYGNTSNKVKFNKNYFNLDFKKSIFKSSSKSYIKEFLKIEKKHKSNIIELHNRPLYLKYLKDLSYAKKVLYFHNDPLVMNGSKLLIQRQILLDQLDKIIFNSEWSKTRFIKDFPKEIKYSNKLEVIKQSVDKKKINLKKKKKIITFIGKLNKAKGYDIFGKAVIPILNEFKDWKALVIGDEPRENIIFKHPNLKILGFKKHQTVLKFLEKTSISIVCSRWNEPFGRTSMEAASRGCCVLISNKGGLKETLTNGIIINDLSPHNFTKKIKELILNPKKILDYQKKSLKNFSLTNKKSSIEIDSYRKKLIVNDLTDFNPSKLKILHITNLNERHNGRLFYTTGRRINNGLIRLNHKVLTLSDRDIVSNYRSFSDFNGSKKLNKIFLETVKNFRPNLILLGHADLIKEQSLKYIKENYPNIKISQWFLDRMDSGWKNNRLRFLDKIKFMDCSFCTTDPYSLNLGNNNVYYMPNPVDHSVDDIKVYENNHPEYDLFFAMSHGVHRGVLKKGKYDEREKIIKYLIKKNPDLKFNIFGMGNYQPVWGDDFKKNLYNSKIGLNLSQGKPLKYYSSDRIAQLMGNGIATLIDKRTKLNKFFTNQEAIFYNSKEDLNKKIRYILSNDKLRIKIAKKGHRKYHKSFNSKIIANYIISKIFEIDKKKISGKLK